MRARVQSDYPSTFAAAPDRFPITFAETQLGPADEGTLVLAFGPSAEELPLADEARVARELGELLPDAAVEPSAATTGRTTRSPGDVGRLPTGMWLRWAPELGRTEGRTVSTSPRLARTWTARSRPGSARRARSRSCRESRA